MPFIWSAIFAYLLSPLITKLEAKKVNRTIAALLVVTPFVIVCWLAFILLIPFLQREFFSFLSDFPNYIIALQEFIEQFLHEKKIPYLQESWTQIKSEWTKYIPSLLGYVSQGMSGIAYTASMLANTLLNLILIPILTYYFAKDWQKILNFISNLFPQHNAKALQEIFTKIDYKVSGFIRGQLIISIIFSIFYAFGLWLVDLPHGILIGILTGFFSFIPVIVILLGFLASLLLAIFQVDTSYTLWGVLIIFGVGQLLENLILIPKFVGSKVGIQPIWVLFALFAFGSVFGFIGLLFAVPLAAIFGVFITYLIDEYLKSDYYISRKPPS